MKNSTILIVLFLSLVSCARKPVVIPPGLLTENEMTEILSDLHIAQSALNDRVGNKLPEGKTDDYLELILQNHHTTRDKFLKSLKFYSENPEILYEVYDSVMLKLNTPEQ